MDVPGSIAYIFRVGGGRDDTNNPSLVFKTTFRYNVGVSAEATGKADVG